MVRGLKKIIMITIVVVVVIVVVYSVLLFMWFMFILPLFFYAVQKKKISEQLANQQDKITVILDRRLLHQPSRQTLGTVKYLTQGN